MQNNRYHPSAAISSLAHKTTPKQSRSDNTSHLSRIWIINTSQCKVCHPSGYHGSSTHRSIPVDNFTAYVHSLLDTSCHNSWKVGWHSQSSRPDSVKQIHSNYRQAGFHAGFLVGRERKVLRLDFFLLLVLGFVRGTSLPHIVWKLKPKGAILANISVGSWPKSFGSEMWVWEEWEI